MEAVGVRPSAVTAWAVVGALWALVVLGLASIGLLVAPVAIVATAVVARAQGRTGLLGALLGAAAVSAALLVPFLT